VLNQMGLGWLFECRDMTRETIERLHGNLENLKKAGEISSHSITGSLMKFAGAAVGMSAVVGGAVTVAAFELAEHSDRMSLALSQAGAAAGATAAQMREFEEVVRTKSLDSLRGSAIGMAEALRDLAKEGFNANEATKALDGTLMLTRISMGALGSADSAAIVHDSLRQFNMQASQAGELTDKLAFALRHFGFQASELRGAMSGLASGAQLVGASLDDTLIAVGLVHSAFPSATKSAAAMNMAMQQLASTRVQRELRGIGVATTDASGKILPLIDIISNLNTHTSRLTEAQLAQKLETIAGGRAAGGLSAIIEGLRKGVTDTTGKILTGGDAIAHLRDQMAKTNGTAKAMSDMLGTTMGDSITALKNAISNAGTAIGSGFEGPFMKAIQGANLFIRGLTQLFTQGGFSGEVKEGLDKHLGIKEFAKKIFMWVKRIEHFFDGLSDSFTAAFAPFKPLLDPLVKAFGALGQALGLTSQTADDNAASWDAFGSAGNTTGSVLGNLAGNILPQLISVIDSVTKAVDFVKGAIDVLGPTLSGVWETFKGTFNLLEGLFTGDWKKMWDGLIDTVVGASKAIVSLVLGMMHPIASIIDSIGAVTGQDYGLTGMVSQMQAGVKSGAIERGAQGLKDLVPASAPAAAAQSATAEQSRAAAAQLAKMFPALDFMNPEKEVHIHAHVNLDGENIATATAKARRAQGARSFHPVTATEGAF